jgi:cardiolipin synthase
VGSHIEFWQNVREAWPTMVATAHVVLALIGSSHAILSKPDPKSAVGWVGLVWLSPFIGLLLYYIFGINRIRRKAVAIMGADKQPVVTGKSRELLDRFRISSPAAINIAAVGDSIGGFPLTSGNEIKILVNGDEAYPRMLKAIDEAKTSVMLASYIFDYDEAGMRFLHSLSAAVKRGVEVRVLIDATGSRYSIPSIVPALKNAGIRAARFMPNFAISKMSALNLRTHRKIMVVDGIYGFTGGLNIRAGNYVKKSNAKKAIQDLHFELQGPAVAHLSRAFIEDWMFTTKELLAGPTWNPEIKEAGSMLARGILDGPDKDFEKIVNTLYSALMSARKSIKIITPYFLPDISTIKLLSLAVHSGVKVEIVLPEHNNIPMISWASMSLLKPLIEAECLIYFSGAPFDHSKMMIVDDIWSFIGSSNWDARSLLLNFEFNVEVYDATFAFRLAKIFADKKAVSRLVSIEEISSRKLHLRLRDGVVRLLAPYL